MYRWPTPRKPVQPGERHEFRDVAVHRIVSPLKPDEKYADVVRVWRSESRELLQIQRDGVRLASKPVRQGVQQVAADGSGAALSYPVITP